MKVLIGCEFSGIVREAFTKLGHDAVSCDLLPTEITGNHIQDNILNHLNENWDLMIAFPPCTYLCVTGNKWMNHPNFPDRHQKREEAFSFFMTLFNANIRQICIENPVGIISTRYRKPDQIIQPYQFGETTTKKTCLWLKNLPLLKPTKIVQPINYIYKTGLKKGKKDSFWHVNSMKLPQEERMKARSRTFKGIAEAMATQWGKINDLQVSLSHTWRKQAIHQHPLKQVPSILQTAKTVHYYPLISELDDQP